jgi:hypothetical protein
LTFSSDIQPTEATAFRASFMAVDQLVGKFQNYLTPMNLFQGTAAAHDDRDILVTYSLAYAATIQLHKNFASRNAGSNQKCLGAVSAVVMIVNKSNLSEYVHLDPIMGVSPHIYIDFDCVLDGLDCYA